MKAAARASPLTQAARFSAAIGWRYAATLLILSTQSDDCKMPHIYYLNPPPNPFWDFVAGVEDHPFFRGLPRHPHRHSPPPQPAGRPAENAQPEAARSQPAEAEVSEKAQGKQPSVEDPPEVDRSTIKPAAAANARDNDNPFLTKGLDEALEEAAGPQHPFIQGFGSASRGRGGWGRDRGRNSWRGSGPPAFMAGHPFFARPPWEHHEGGPRPGQPGPPPPPPPHHRGRRGFGPHRGPSHEGRRGPGCHRRPSPPRNRPGLDVGEFLNKLGNKLGIDLSNAAEGLGLAADKFTAGRTSPETDFEPRTDIFENKDNYTIHLSVPGAKKSDIGVDYDGEHSTLRITGVVHRPNVDEQMLKELVVDGRKRETGVFEKAIRLGTKNEPANIDVAGITAKMQDGVLIVRIPKTESVHHKREVPISADPESEGHADYDDEYSEKPVLFDAEEVASTADQGKRDEIDLIDMKDKEGPKEQEPESASTETKDKKPIRTTNETEQLPKYTSEAGHEDDWDKVSEDSGEGEYIKINVD